MIDLYNEIKYSHYSQVFQRAPTLNKIYIWTERE